MTSKPDIQFKLRLPDALKERLERAAADSGRSISAEIIHRLERSFPGGVNSLIMSNRFHEIAVVDSELFDLEAKKAAVLERLEHYRTSGTQKERTEALSKANALGQKIAALRSRRAALHADVADLTDDALNRR